MQRYAASIQYRGTRYYGWQRQDYVPTVAAAVTQAICKVANHAVDICCAGRTDKGVHAVSQVIHFDSSSCRSLRAWLLGINRFLPDDISLNWIVPVAADFHARFRALSRRYLYMICCAPVRPALLHQQVLWTHDLLHVEKMHQAAQFLRGEHDFTSFRSAECQSATAKRNVYSISVYHQAAQQSPSQSVSQLVSQSLMPQCIRDDPAQHQLLIVDITANAFLHHMVRTIAGSLLLVGRGVQPTTWIAEVLAQKNRALAGETAPAEGLYLQEVRYPEQYLLA